MCIKPYEKKKHSLIEIYNKYFDSYLKDPLRKLKILDRHLEAVRKAQSCKDLKLGAIVLICESCGIHKLIYRTCKHRFCSNCSGASTYQWAEKILGTLLNMPHHHIVMTLPKELRILSRLNGNKLHNWLFQLSNKVVRSYMKERYGLLPGIVSVLHTSGSDLKYHPHVHMIVSRGGKLLGSENYKRIGGEYLVKNEELGNRLRKEYLRKIKEGIEQGNLKLSKRMKEGQGIIKTLERLGNQTWIVNIEKPLADTLSIVNYVGRYSKRSCVSEYKLEQISPTIKLRCKDYKNSERGKKPIEKIIEYSPTQFLDMLLQHVPEKGYKMVRYGGLYNSYYKGDIPLDNRSLLSKVGHEKIEREEDYDWGELEQMRKYLLKKGYADPQYCYECKSDMKYVGILNKEGELKGYADSG